MIRNVESIPPIIPLWSSVKIHSSTSPNTTSSMTSLSTPKRCWLVRLFFSIIEFFKSLFFIPRPPTPPAPIPRRISVVLPSPQPPVVVIATPLPENGYANWEPTPKDKEKIKDIFHEIATASYWYLFRNQTEIVRKAAEIQDVHPYKCLKELLTTLRPDLKKIRQSTFKWPFFIDNLSASFNARSHEELLSYLPDFAKELGCAPSTLQPFVVSRDWMKLVLELLKN